VAEERFWAGGEAVLGFGQWGAARGVACVGVWGVDVERVSGVGVDEWYALGRGVGGVRSGVFGMCGGACVVSWCLEE
jgi:hypothetical protein